MAKPRGTIKKDEKKPYHHGNLREALVQAGLEILTKEGAQALSLREAARRANVSHAAPYRHFPNKETLIAAIAEDGFRNLSKQLGKAINKFPNDSRSQLMEAGRAYVGFALERPDHLQVMFGNYIQDHTVYPSLEEASKAAFGQLIGVIRACQDAGLVTPGKPVLFAMSIWSMIHGLAVLMIQKKIPPMVVLTEEQITQSSIQILFDGLFRKNE